MSGDVDESALDADGVDKLRMMEQLIRSTENALRDDDPATAASLSRKARLLAEELVGE